MNIPGRTVFLAPLLIALTFACALPAQAGGVVSTCDETHLRSALSGGGTVTFACSGRLPSRPRSCLDLKLYLSIYQAMVPGSSELVHDG
jgi:hypothetical protein